MIRDLRTRLAGALLLVASGGSTLLHRHIYDAARHGPAQLAELAVGLLTLVLASAGVLLIVHGSKLFGPTKGPVQPDRFMPTKSEFEVSRLLASGSPEAVLLDSRRGVALLLAHRALANAAVSRAIVSERAYNRVGMASEPGVARGGSRAC